MGEADEDDDMREIFAKSSRYCRNALYTDAIKGDCLSVLFFPLTQRFVRRLPSTCPHIFLASSLNPWRWEGIEGKEVVRVGAFSAISCQLALSTRIFGTATEYVRDVIKPFSTVAGTLSVACQVALKLNF